MFCMQYKTNKKTVCTPRPEALSFVMSGAYGRTEDSPCPLCMQKQIRQAVEDMLFHLRNRWINNNLEEKEKKNWHVTLPFSIALLRQFERECVCGRAWKAELRCCQWFLKIIIIKIIMNLLNALQRHTFSDLKVGEWFFPKIGLDCLIKLSIFAMFR